MTKEEEAIKILSDSNILFNIQRDTALSIRVAIETVLNMLKDLQRENKSLTQTNRSYKGMIKKKDKQIDLMADNLVGMTIWDTEKEEPLILTDKEDIKQYFERKVKDD